MVDPADPAQQFRVAIDKREPVREMTFATSNYTEPLRRFDFLRYLGNSVFVTVDRHPDHAADQFDGGLRARDLRIFAASKRRRWSP